MAGQKSVMQTEVGKSGSLSPVASKFESVESHQSLPFTDGCNMVSNSVHSHIQTLAMYYWGSSHEKVKTGSLFWIWVRHGTCFGQWNDINCEDKQRLEKHLGTKDGPPVPLRNQEMPRPDWCKTRCCRLSQWSLWEEPPSWWASACRCPSDLSSDQQKNWLAEPNPNCWLTEQSVKLLLVLGGVLRSKN